MSVRIIGTGSYLPKKVADNNFLSTIVDTDDEWIRQRTGIKERHLSNGKEGTTYMAAHAAEAALENAGIGADELDMIIVATVSADTYVPSTSCSVQGAIGAIRATCFDINAACSGFLFALNTAYAYIEMGMAKTVLVAGAETLSREVDWSDRGSCILFGDGSGAAIVQKDDSNVGGLIASVTGSDGTQGDVLTCKGRGIQNPFHNSKRKKDYIRMDGQAVFRFAVTMVPRCVKQILKKTETDVDDIKFFVLHQANVRILELIAKRLKVDIDKFPMNLDRYGNTSSASIPILLDELNRNHLLERGDKIILSGFGGGLTWGAMLIEWYIYNPLCINYNAKGDFYFEKDRQSNCCIFSCVFLYGRIVAVSVLSGESCRKDKKRVSQCVHNRCKTTES